jgi:transcriptional regulator with XRE-family HTH domain
MSPKGYSHYRWMATDICIRFGKRVRALRLKRGWKQIDFAVHTGLGRVYISDLENGKKEPRLRTVEIIALSFDISVSQLTKGL